MRNPKNNTIIRWKSGANKIIDIGKRIKRNRMVLPKKLYT